MKLLNSLSLNTGHLLDMANKALEELKLKPVKDVMNLKDLQQTLIKNGSAVVAFRDKEGIKDICVVPVHTGEQKFSSVTTYNKSYLEKFLPAFNIQFFTESGIAYGLAVISPKSEEEMKAYKAEQEVIKAREKALTEVKSSPIGESGSENSTPSGKPGDNTGSQGGAGGSEGAPGKPGDKKKTPPVVV